MDPKAILKALRCLKTVTAGATSLVAGMCEEVGLVDVIDEALHWDKARWRLSPGRLIEGLVICILSDRKALYRVEEFYEGKDTESLFGKGVRACDFNDDALARALDRLFEAGGNRVLGQVISSALEVHEVSVDAIHFDTTSLSVQGEYEDQDRPDAIEIVFGHSTDRRPDLKQIKFGVGVTREGVLNYGEVLSGNGSDKKWNGVTIARLKDLFPKEVLKDLIYVADSSFVTEGNLEEAAKHEVKFVSRVPATFAVTSELIEKAWEEDKWESIGGFSSQKGAAHYWACEYPHKIAGRDYRFIVVRSSSMDARKEKSIKKAIERSRKEIEQEARELLSREFVCKPDAEKAAELFIRKWRDGFHELSYEVIDETIVGKRPRPGRPRKDEEPPDKRVVYKANVRIEGLDEAQVNRARERESCFVLITNLMDAGKYPPKRILGEYKEQTTVEARFSFLKSPYLLGQVFLKKQSRVEALGYVLLMALLLATLLERRVRRNLKAEGEPIMIPGKRMAMQPTARMILEMLDTAQVTHIEYGGKVRRVWHDRRQLFDLPRLLRLAGFSEDIYVRDQPPQRTEDQQND